MKRVTFSNLINAYHPYYCTLSRWNEKDSVKEYDNFEDFCFDWGGCDYDYNLLFRYDISPKDGNETGQYTMELFFMLQRKGLFVPVRIRTVTESDEDIIINFLEPRWKYMKQLWEPINKL